MTEKFYQRIAERVVEALGLDDDAPQVGTFAAPTVSQVHIEGGGGPMTKDAANYRTVEAGGCDTCALGDDCPVEGGGESGHICDRWTATERMSDVFFIPFSKGGETLLFPIGPFYRDGRERQFSPEDAAEMVRNFKDNVLGRVNGWLPINKEHGRGDGRIAWIKDALLKDDKPHIVIEPVPGQEQELAKFDYFSPEIRWEWQHPKTGETYRNVLFGGAATNYPFHLGDMVMGDAPIVGFAKSDATAAVWDGEAWEAFADLPDLRQAREARAKKYSIGVKAGGALTPPRGYPADEKLYGDPTNYKYPADKERALPAVQYFNHSGQREAGGYTPEEWAIVGKRVARLAGEALDVDYQYKDGRVVRGEEQASEPVVFEHVVEFGGVDDAQRVLYGTVFVPGVIDGQGHVVSAEEVERACHDFTERLQLDEQHRRLVQSDDARVVETWIQREPALWKFDGRETEIPVGAWCMAVKVYSDELWADVVSGEIAGFSPVGKALGRPA